MLQYVYIYIYIIYIYLHEINLDIFGISEMLWYLKLKMYFGNEIKRFNVL